MKKVSIKIAAYVAVNCLLSAVMSCSSNSKSVELEKICGTWEVYSGISYDISDLKVLSPEEPFEDTFKWKLVIEKDGKITKPASGKYDKAQTANYKLYTGSEALKNGIIEKKYQRRAADSSDDDILLLVTDKLIIDERLIQIVNCTSDTLTIRFLSSSKYLKDDIFEYKLVKIK